MENKPIKRHKALQPISREHHHGLLLCWKIREGFKRNIAVDRIDNYAKWCWKTHLADPFEIEETHLFPVLEKGNKLVEQAKAEHKRIKQLFENEANRQASLNSIADELEQHIRFEERVLFNEIQAKASSEQLQNIQACGTNQKFDDNLTDAFWQQ